MDSGVKQAVGPSVDNCMVDLGGCVTQFKVYVTSLGTYVLVIGMNWLEEHRAFLDYYEKKVLCVDDKGKAIEIHDIKQMFSLRFISTMNIKQCMGNGCYLYIIEAISNEKGPSLNQY